MSTAQTLIVSLSAVAIVIAICLTSLRRSEQESASEERKDARRAEALRERRAEDAATERDRGAASP